MTYIRGVVKMSYDQFVLDEERGVKKHDRFLMAVKIAQAKVATAASMTAVVGAAAAGNHMEA